MLSTRNYTYLTNIVEKEMRKHNAFSFVRPETELNKGINDGSLAKIGLLSET